MNWIDLFRTHAADAEEYSAGEWIYREGEPGTLLFVLLAGDVELSQRGAHLVRLSAPDFFGEAAALGSIRRGESSRALSAARVLPGGPPRFSSLCDKHPALRVVLAAAARNRSAAVPETDEPTPLAQRS
jgi:CRP-like cAMP-binding protein